MKHTRGGSPRNRDHPTWSVLFQYRNVAAYLQTFDVVGTDPYPISRSSASMTAEWTAETFRQVEGARPLWQVPQQHNWANYPKTEAGQKGGRTPTSDEVRSMAWQCICHSARGLVFYSWFDMQRNPDAPFDIQRDGLKRLAAEIDQRASMLLSIKPVPAVTAAGDAPGGFHWPARVRHGKLYFIAVNDGDGEGTVAFRLPAVPTSARELGENRLVEMEGATLPVRLPRLAVQCYEITLPGRSYGADVFLKP